MTELGCIIEIEGSGARETDIKRYDRAIDTLQNAIIHGEPVRYVDVQRPVTEDICTVPHFGHSSLCDRNGCAPALPFGVKRYFTVRAILVDARLKHEVLGTYQLTEHARMEVCRYGSPGYVCKVELNQTMSYGPIPEEATA